MEKVEKPTGGVSKIAIMDNSVSGLCTCFSPTAGPNSDLTAVFDIVFSDTNIMYALHDLAEAIQIPNVGIINSARAVERIKHVITPDDHIDDRIKWVNMRNALNIDRAYIDYIMDPSKMHRHGRPYYVRGPEAIEITKRAWIIMNRFLEMRKTGLSKLDVTVFPFLGC